jgi:hypothetical protein
MERVNITIGRVTFDHADYDADNDVLYLKDSAGCDWCGVAVAICW